jgi:hypothetical protein
MNKLYKTTIFTVLSLLLCFGVTSHGAFPDSYTLYDQFIDINNNRTYEVFFPYGNQYLGKDINDISISIKSNGLGLDIIKDQAYDYYFTQQDVDSNLNFPSNKYLDCSLIPRYKDAVAQKDKQLKGAKIQSEFITPTGIVKYGPQSIPSAPITKLKSNATGCIGLTLKINSPKAGEIVELTMDSNINMSKDYEETQRPGIKTIAFIFKDDTNRCDAVKGEIFVKGKCSVKCENNQVNNIDTGSCEVRKRICNPLEEDVSGNCYQKCNPEQTRDKTSGICKASAEISIQNTPSPFDRINFIPYLIFSSLVIIATSIYIILATRKNRK